MALDAPLVFVGYGIDMPSHGFDDYRGIDARGKIVVMLSGVPEGTPSDVAAHLSSEKRRMAGAHGAVGMITIRTRADAASAPWERAARFGNRPGTTWLEPNGTPYSDTGGHALPGDAQRGGGAAACSPPPTGRSNPILDQAAAPAQRPRGFAMRLSAHVTRDAGTQTRMSSPNVVAILPGTDPSVANEYVMLTAHLDHIGIREPRPGDAANADRINNGAMDNATGIATLIEVARAFSRPGNRPRRPIIIAAVTAEEKGLLGAEFLARHPVVGERPGDLRRQSRHADPDLRLPGRGRVRRRTFDHGADRRAGGGADGRRASRPIRCPEEGLFTRSDHYNFVRMGVPSVFLMTGFANGGEAQFRGFLANRYHNAGDDLSQNINWQAGAKFAQLNYLITREIADGTEVPRWYRGSFFGDAFGGDQPRAVAPAGAAARRCAAAAH